MANTALAFYDGHVYINGIVNSISSNTITISHTNYKIDQKCKIVKILKKNNSFHEAPAQMSDVSTGKSITAKVIGGIIYEIIVEEWKR
jgi:hypothetical protein